MNILIKLTENILTLHSWNVLMMLLIFTVSCFPCGLFIFFVLASSVPVSCFWFCSPFVVLSVAFAPVSSLSCYLLSIYAPVFAMLVCQLFLVDPCFLVLLFSGSSCSLFCFVLFNKLIPALSTPTLPTFIGLPCYRTTDQKLELTSGYAPYLSLSG